MSELHLLVRVLKILFILQDVGVMGLWVSENYSATASLFTIPPSSPKNTRDSLKNYDLKLVNCIY